VKEAQVGAGAADRAGVVSKSLVGTLVAGVAGLVFVLVVADPAAAATPRAFVVAAHRGGMGLWPQNSAVAFDGAVRAGYDMIETDVRSTSDGVLVLWHNENLTPGCRGRYSRQPLAALTWAQVSAVSCGGQPIARFDALVARLTEADAHRVRLFAETKQRGLTARVLDAGRPLGLRLNLQSFDAADLSRRVPSCLIGGDPGVYERAFASRAATCVGVTADLATPDLVAAAHRAHRVVYVWTVDDPAAMRSLACRWNGVDGIITNRPDLATALSCD
jgi:glycerophosphoryl diester phosphodiesterase